MKKLKCYNCKFEKHVFYAEENGFTLVKCAVCGLFYVENRPEDCEIAQANKQGKHIGIKEFDVMGKYNPGKIPQYIKVLEDLLKVDFGRKETWLDVGC